MGVRGILEVKDFEVLNIVFRTKAALIDRAVGVMQSAPITRVHTMYAKLKNTLRPSDAGGASLDVLVDKTSDTQKFKDMLKSIFDEHCISGLYMMKLHLLDHILEDLEEFGSLVVLNSSLFERSNINIKSSNQATAEQQHGGLRETVEIINSHEM